MGEEGEKRNGEKNRREWNYLDELENKERASKKIFLEGAIMELARHLALQFTRMSAPSTLSNSGEDT